MATKKDDTEWTDRDDLAARLFEVVVTGTLASGKSIGSDGTPEAITAYKYADAFLRVRQGNGSAGRT
jgi:hypothetical protein